MKLDKAAAQEMGLSKEELEKMGVVMQSPHPEPQQPITLLEDIEKAVKETVGFRFHKYCPSALSYHHPPQKLNSFGHLTEYLISIPYLI